MDRRDTPVFSLTRRNDDSDPPEFEILADGEHDADVAPTVDGTYIILAGGFQWGPTGSPRDRSGAAGDEWPTPMAALNAWAEAHTRNREA